MLRSPREEQIAPIIPLARLSERLLRYAGCHSGTYIELLFLKNKCRDKYYDFILHTRLSHRKKQTSLILTGRKQS